LSPLSYHIIERPIQALPLTNEIPSIDVVSPPIFPILQFLRRIVGRRFRLLMLF